MAETLDEALKALTDRACDVQGWWLAHEHQRAWDNHAPMRASPDPGDVVNVVHDGPTFIYWQGAWHFLPDSCREEAWRRQRSGSGAMYHADLLDCFALWTTGLKS